MHFSRFVHIFRQEPGHILRQRGCYRQAAAGDGVGQLQLVGVQGRAGDQGSVLGAVEPVPQQGVANGGQVQPQLPKGYRYYLDHLLEAPAAIALSAADRENIDRLFADMDVEPEKLAQSAARALADYTGCAAVATTPQAEDLCIAHFEVVQVGRYSAAVLAVTSSGGVRTRVARIHTGLTREDADEMARLLNSSLTFVAPEDLTPSLTASLVLSAGRRLAPVVFAAEALVRTRPQFYLEGVQYLAKMPDVRTNLGALLEVFSDNEAARALIEPGSGKVTATLGEDIEPAMPNLCIVSKRYLAGGGLYGTVAVIGSNRMEYEHLIPVLNYFAIKLGQSMSGKKEEQI